MFQFRTNYAFKNKHMLVCRCENVPWWRLWYTLVKYSRILW